MNTYAIIEIGSNNTKTHIYSNNKLIYEKTSTIDITKKFPCLKEEIPACSLKEIQKEINKHLKDITFSSRCFHISWRRSFLLVSECELFIN